MTPLLQDRALRHAQRIAPGLLARIVDHGPHSGHYFVYQRAGEQRIAGGRTAAVSVFADHVCVHVRGKTTRCRLNAADPFQQVRDLSRAFGETWTAYGYVAFDLARFYYPYSWHFDSPLLELVAPEFEVRLNSGGVHVWCPASLERARITEAVQEWHEDTEVPTPTPPLLDEGDREEFESRVRATIRAIRAGMFQKVIVSRCVRFPGPLDVLATYASASQDAFAARSYCFQSSEVAGAGLSPEILLTCHGNGMVTTNPLAGTRSRADDQERDRRLGEALSADAKEIKEHVLAVITAQEEISKVCRKETLRIHEFMTVKKRGGVQHLSTRISGQLSTGRTVWDALRSLFPGVTVSGVPKREALRWISEIEERPRGVYGGAVGWIDSEGKADFGLALRSVFQYGQTVHLNAGAGIVAESLAEREFLESANKMNVMRKHINLVHG